MAGRAEPGQVAGLTTAAPMIAGGGRPLDGIRVLDLSRLIPGPWCTLLLADLGAEIIKVETPRAGDYSRMAPPELGSEGLFEALNRGKQSIAVNYRLPRGRAAILRLAATADVFFEASLPGQLARRGLGPDDLRAANPRIVYCSLSAFGQDGPYRDRPAHDLNQLAIGGVLALLGAPGARPVPPGIQLADLAGGSLAAFAIVAALLRRERTGEGAVVDVSILDAIVSWFAPLGRSATTAGVAPSFLSGAYPCYAVYPAADGAYLAVGALEPQFWVAFCAGIGREDLVPRQFDGTAIREVETVLAQRPRVEWLDLLGAAACVAPVNAPDEALRDPQVRARGMATGEGAATRIATPFGARFRPGWGGASSNPADGGVDTRGNADREAAPARADRPPILGEHTFEVLEAAGFTPDEVAKLAEAAIIAGPATPEATARAARLGSVLVRLAERHRPKG